MMRSLLRAVAAGLAILLPAAAAGFDCGAGAAVEASVQADYAVEASRGPLALVGEGTVSYQRQGDRYRMSSTLRALGLIDVQQHSDGQVGRYGLAPRSFVHRAGQRPPLSVDFDWTAGRVTFHPDGSAEPIRLRTQDRLSLLLQLAWQLRDSPNAAEFELPVAGSRRIATYRFVSRGAETLDLPAGRHETIRFERRPDSRDDLLEVWLAPGLCSLPVRVRFRDERGLIVDQRLRAIRLLPP